MNLVNLVVFLLYIKNSLGKDKIIGGSPVAESKFPFLVCIKYWKCGATLIKEDVVLTAAHCFFNNENEMIWPSSLRAYGGTVDLSHDQEYQVGYNLIAHPKYRNSNSEWVGYDCGIMELRSKFKLYLGSIGYEIEVYQFDFPSLGKITNDMIERREECWSVGWGSQENDNGISKNFSFVLNEFKSNLISYEQCERESYFRIYRQTFSIQSRAMLCTADKTRKKKGTCKGDSGSPIICDCVVLGVLSGGPSPFCGQDDTPSFYTRIDYVEKFVKPYTSVGNVGAKSKASITSTKNMLYFVIKNVMSMIFVIITIT